MTQLEDLFLSGSLSKERFVTRNEPLQERLSSIKNELNSLNHIEDKELSLVPIDLGETWANSNDDVRRELANLIIQKIEAGISSLTITFIISPSSL